MKTVNTISLTHHLPTTDQKLLIPKFTESTATNHRTANLFTPLTIGDLRLPNRVIMSPLTRARAGATRTPNGLMAEYYRQRASAGLIISEATSVDPMGVGYADTPGIWSEAQVQGWRGVTDALLGASPIRCFSTANCRSRRVPSRRLAM